ncbi:MAG: hypothetical protein KDE27_13000 [Planctomycetes bacterium]|nr:hypothetical protein [Planctomycetota bacterium]
MRNHLSLPCPSLAFLALLLPATAGAQSVLGILNNTDTSFTSRGSATVPNTNPSVSFVRLDKEAYAGWGVNPATPGMREILGMNGVLQDQIDTTPDTYGLVVYTEDVANPNYPDVTTPVGSVGPISLPTGTSGAAAAWAINVNFTTPMLAPATGDVFLGVDMPQPLTGTWPTDGVSCHALYYVSVTSGINDLPGGSHPTTSPEDNNGGWYSAVSTLPPTYTTTQRQWKLQPLVAGAAGVAGTITNQTSAPQSNAAPGTSSMASGLYPDAANPPLNAGRADDIVSRWYMSGAPAGTLVFFLASFNAFGPEIPLSTFVPGSGVVCLDTAAFFQIGFSPVTADQAFFTWTLTPAARSAVAGLRIVHQSIGLDPATGMAMANGCTRQLL